MKKIFLLSLLFILLTTTAYGANFYSGIKFQNTATDEYIVSWTSTGNQFKWISADTIGAAMTATGADAIVSIVTGGVIGSLLADTTPQLGGNLDQNGSLMQETAETAFTDSDAPIPNLASAAQLIKFTDDGTTDIDTITGFSNIVTGVVYKAEFVDAYWKVQFSSGNLKGHAGNDWSPRAHDSMLFWTNDGTNINCIVSMPTTIPVTQYYEMPFDSTPASNLSWGGPTRLFANGQAGVIAAGDLVYIHPSATAANRGQVQEWDADLATYKNWKPIGIAIESFEAAKTSGTLTVGEIYVLDNFIAGDDFSNIGATNEDGNEFTATGTTPTTWTNSSVVRHIAKVGVGAGVWRDDALNFTDATDEGKTVYGTTTAGEYSVTAPAVAGDVVCAVGIVSDDDVIEFNFGLCASVEVP